jgi:hypothetical protein
MTYKVTQQPFVYQTAWFQALGVAALLGMLCGLYWYRMRQIAHEFNVRLEERVTERTRIARELHDTLLQSFQGLMLRLQVVDYLLPEGDAKNQLEQTLQRADQAIAEGRTAVYDLRSSTTTTNDLAEAVKALGEELATPESGDFRLEVAGAPRDLHSIIRDEIYRIARKWCAMPSATQRLIILKQRFPMTNGRCACASGTTERVYQPTSWKRGAAVIMVCAECASAPGKLAASWKSGAGWEQALKLN